MTNIFSIAGKYLKNIDIKHIRMSFASGGEPLEVNNEFINILAEDKKKRYCSTCCYTPPKSLKETNDFINFIMDPFQMWHPEALDTVSDEDEEAEDIPNNRWLKSRTRKVARKKKSIHELV